MRASAVPVLLFLLVSSTLAACGGAAAPPAGTGVAAGSDVQITGHVTSPGTRGSILVFAYTGNPAPAALAESEPASLTSVEADGDFVLTVPPADSVALAFLADGSSDGVIDGGDPVVVLSDARLAGLQAGDAAQLSDVALDFTGAHVSVGAIEVQHAGAPAAPTFTPTAAPSS